MDNTHINFSIVRVYIPIHLLFFVRIFFPVFGPPLPVTEKKCRGGALCRCRPYLGAKYSYTNGKFQFKRISRNIFKLNEIEMEEEKLYTKEIHWHFVCSTSTVFHCPLCRRFAWPSSSLGRLCFHHLSRPSLDFCHTQTYKTHNCWYNHLWIVSCDGRSCILLHKVFCCSLLAPRTILSSSNSNKHTQYFRWARRECGWMKTSRHYELEKAATFLGLCVHFSIEWTESTLSGCCFKVRERARVFVYTVYWMNMHSIN